ncbi:hypothetical protein ACTXGU_09015 [Niallia sp. 01092]|uniref:hypothetical protein n=1 Tax=Niallia sp. 01092 TaxID=3457759 RepID=UPI003FD04199
MIQISSWVIYAVWAVFGFMLLDFLFGLFKSFVTWKLSPEIITNYLKDILYFVIPLITLTSLFPIDPTGWILLIFYYICSVGIIWMYIIRLIDKWRA